MRKIGSIFHDNCTEIWSGSTATQSISSGIETHENGACNIEIYKNIGAEGGLSKNGVSNDHVQDFNVSLNQSLSVEKSSINKHNVTDEGNLQVKSSNQESR